MTPETCTPGVGALTRVEGEGAAYQLHGGAFQSVQLNIYGVCPTNS